MVEGVVGGGGGDDTGAVSENGGGDVAGHVVLGGGDAGGCGVGVGGGDAGTNVFLDAPAQFIVVVVDGDVLHVLGHILHEPQCGVGGRGGAAHDVDLHQRALGRSQFAVGVEAVSRDGAAGLQRLAGADALTEGVAGVAHHATVGMDDAADVAVHVIHGLVDVAVGVFGGDQAAGCIVVVGNGCAVGIGGGEDLIVLVVGGAGDGGHVPGVGGGGEVAPAVFLQVFGGRGAGGA